MPSTGSVCGGGRILQGDERFGRGAPQRRLIGSAGFHLAAEHAVAEVVEQQEAVVEILRVDARHGESGGVQGVGDGDERAHVLGEVREAAVGQVRCGWRGHPAGAASP